MYYVCFMRYYLDSTRAAGTAADVLPANQRLEGRADLGDVGKRKIRRPAGV